jgi:hypothetical protein
MDMVAHPAHPAVVQQTLADPRKSQNLLGFTPLDPFTGGCPHFTKPLQKSPPYYRMATSENPLKHPATTQKTLYLCCLAGGQFRNTTPITM